MSSPFIIATIMRTQGETGVQAYFNMFSDYLCSEDIENCIVTPFMNPKWLVLPTFGMRKVIDPFNKDLSIWWYRYWHYLLLKQALKKKLSALDSEDVIIFAQCPLSAKAALEIRAIETQKVIMTVHFNISQADEWVGKRQISCDSWLYHQIKNLESEIIPKVDKLIYSSDFMKGVIETNIPGSTLIESSVLPSFVKHPNSSIQLATQGDLISIGTLEPRKNHRYLLFALAEAKRKDRCYSLTLVGDGSERKNLETLARSLDIYSQVTFAGFQPNAASLLPYHRAYVHSASLDNRPIAVLEALAYSLPVVAAPTGGISECFTDGVEGFYWSLSDPTMGADRLIQLLENPELYASMSKAAKEKFDTTFSHDAIAHKLIHLLTA